MFISKIAETLFVPSFEKKFYRINDTDFQIPKIKEVGAYLHIPFCKSLCPYCPYDKFPFKEQLAKEFTSAAIREIEKVASTFGKFKINSLYIGGGTPTIIGKDLCKIVQSISKNFDTTSWEIFLETSPYDVSDEKMKMLKECGVSMISIGIQSFKDKYLKLIGRNYDSKRAFQSIKIAKKYFNNINIDLMFALPNQTTREFLSDLETAKNIGVSQITSYPLFTFPYTSAGQFLKTKRVKTPPTKIRKKMYYEMYDFLIENNFYPVSVWGFKRLKNKTYSSVTRDNYIGFGPSAATKTAEAFYLNTFSLNEYLKRVKNGKFPQVVKIDLNEKTNNYYWLYWRIYETRIPKKDFANKFMKNNERKAIYLIQIGKKLKFLTEEKDFWQLTKKGMFYVHLLQNTFALNYINKVWGSMMKDPAPHTIYF